MKFSLLWKAQSSKEEGRNDGKHSDYFFITRSAQETGDLLTGGGSLNNVFEHTKLHS